MLVLAFDTSTADGGVVVLKDNETVAEASWVRERSHGEILTAQIERVVAEAGIQLRDLDRLAIGHGPGSFTGVRVSVNAARSLSFALSKPVHVFDTSEIIAAGCARHDLPLAVVINAHKNMVFSTTFRWSGDAWTRETPLAARDPSVFAKALREPHLCLGDGFEEYRDDLTTALLLRDSSVSDATKATSIARLLATLPAATPPLEWNAVQALYIRDSGAEEKLRENH